MSRLDPVPNPPVAADGIGSPSHRGSVGALSIAARLDDYIRWLFI